MKFSFDPENLADCSAMEIFGENCVECGHLREKHHHYSCIWVEKEEDERVIDKVAEKMYYEAESEKLKEAMKAMALKAVDELTRGIEEAIAQVGSLATEYANLSLSGSFAGQIEKSIKLIALNIEKMRHDGSNPEIIGRLEKSMLHM